MDKVKNINRKVCLSLQPTGISCGNTVLKMLTNYYNIGKHISIENLIDIMDTDYQTGTTDLKMIKGLDFFKIPYIQNDTSLLDGAKQIEKLLSILDDNFFIMRTLTRGVFHWILITGYDDNDMFQILDPWLGEIEYSENEILSIWSPRNYDGFSVSRNGFSVSKVFEDDITTILELSEIVFSESGMDNTSYIGGSADWDLSIKITDSNEKIIGFYVFNDVNISIKTNKYTGNGLHGVALGIDPDYKGLGLGKLLINYPIDNYGDRFDYIWGMHLKYLNNINDWLKRRELLNDINSSFYITAGLLNKVGCVVE